MSKLIPNFNKKPYSKTIFKQSAEVPKKNKFDMHIEFAEFVNQLDSVNEGYPETDNESPKNGA